MATNITFLPSAMASNSSDEILPTTSSSFPWKYHVLLSFADADNCPKHFAVSLFKELTSKGFHTIKSEMRDGERSKSVETDRFFLQSVEESRFSFVILSENYVSSDRCLDELVEIVDRGGRTSQAVVPIFYNMDPSALINQTTGTVAEVLLRDHKRREALTKVTSTHGWVTRQWEEKILIQQIVEDISDRLIYTSSGKTNDCVGMGSHIMELENILTRDGTNDVRMVGIWGMGGIGKTTIARIIYDRICDQFEVHCFLEDLKGDFQKHGASALQQKILREKRKIANIWSLTTNVNVMKRRLCRKKVLLVLDDVDDMKQLEALAGEPNWFGAGSRIIIATRDKHLLDAHGVKHTYEVKYLKTDEALQLFSRHAFKQNNPQIEYLDICGRLVSYVQGLPLALKVLGSYLKDASMREWETVLHKVATIPELKIYDVLRVSFDGLDDTQREIFLDIACFFKGEHKNDVRDVLEGCGFFPDIAFAVLKDKALITISDSDMKVEMHDLLQEMGHEIVRQESQEPGQRSRLWIAEEVHQVLTKHKGTKTVEGISLDMTKTREMQLESNAFARMNRLRFLNFYFTGPSVGWEERVHFPCGLQSLSKGIRYLYWSNFPLKSLPSNFCAESLVELMLPKSNLQQLWTGMQNLVNLKKIDLEECRYLAKLPDLSNAKNIESIILQGCESLVELPSSVQHLYKLKKLNLRSCRSLTSLPERIDSKSLEDFTLAGCSNVKKCPEFFGNHFDVDLSWTAISELPESIRHLKAVTLLDLTGCSNITKFPDISTDLQLLYIGDGMHELPFSIHLLSGLVALKINDNKKLVNLPSSIWTLKSLRSLDIKGCPNFESIPEILQPMESVTELYLRRTAIKDLPSTIGNLRSLSTLLLNDCRQLVNLPSTINQLSQLKTVSVSNCKRLSSLPQFPRSLTNLDANNCDSLQALSTASECRLQVSHFTNCFKLNERADSQLAIQLMVTKFCEGTKEARILYAGSEIPERFCERSTGSSVKTQLPLNWHQLKGALFCIIFAIEEVPMGLNFSSPCEYWIRCKCYVKDDNVGYIVIWDRRWFDVDLHLVKSDHVLVWFNPHIISSPDEELNKYCGCEACFEFYFEGYSHILKHCNFIVKKCGVALLFDDDAAINTNFASNQEEDEQPHAKRLKL